MVRLRLALVTIVVVLASSARAAERPNFVILIADDMRADCLSCAGHPVLETPHIDRLAAEGTRFTNAFVTTSICCISRASYLTGQYARRHGMDDFSTALSPAALAASYPAVLHAAGYRTGCLGKWGIGGAEPREVFDTWHAWGGQGEFFEQMDGEEVHNSEMLARRAERFLRADDGRPFCLLVLYKAPHEPFLPDPSDAPLFAGDTFPIPRTYNDEHFAGLPAFIRESEGRIRLMRRHPTPEAYQEFVRQYLRCVAGIDRSVGKILGVLDELRLTDNTTVVFTSDNGFFLGEHGLSGKWLMHEESIRVPLVIRPAGVAGTLRVPSESTEDAPSRLRGDGTRSVPATGETRDELVLNIDLAPTILDVAGCQIPAATDGRSLRPLLEGSDVADWRRDFFYEHHFSNAGTIPRTEGVRSVDRKYITYYDVEPPYEELYDLAADPSEEHNLAADPAEQASLAALRARHRAYLSEIPPP